MPDMAFSTRPGLYLLVHNRQPPEPAIWNQYLAELDRQRTLITRVRTLVFSDGGGPSLVQRRQLNEILRGYSTLVAVVSTSSLVRNIVRALNVFNPDIRVFPPASVEGAYQHLLLSSEERRWSTAERERLTIQLAPTR